MKARYVKRITIRLSDDEAQQLDQLLRGGKASNLIRWLIRRGLEQWKLEQAEQLAVNRIHVLSAKSAAGGTSVRRRSRADKTAGPLR